jgi:hypothetical protein
MLQIVADLFADLQPSLPGGYAATQPCLHVLFQDGNRGA